MSRLLRRAKDVIGECAALGPEAFRSRTRSVRRLAQHLHRVARRKGEAAAEELPGASRKLIGMAAASRAQAEHVRDVLQAQADKTSRRLVERLNHFLPLVEQAIAPATRRVLQGEPGPAREPRRSRVAPHPQVIVQPQAGKDVAFGRKRWLEEVDGSIVSSYRLLDEAGQDEADLAASLAAHQRRFGQPPWLVTGDRGVASAANERLAKDAGVNRVVLPYRGRASPKRQQQERQAWFRRGYRFRAGIEGRISVLRRCYGLDRCRDHGEAGMGRWVGWGIVTANLATIARTVARRTAERPAKAA